MAATKTPATKPPATSPPKGQRMAAAIAVSARWAQLPELNALGAVLGRSGTTLEIVGTLDEALTRLAVPGCVAECVLIDSEHGDARGIVQITAAIERLRRERPTVAPLVAAIDPRVPFVAAAFRAGAADVLDLAGADDLATLKAFDRAAADHRARRDKGARIAELRSLVEEFLRLLVKLERRSLELEAKMNPDDEIDAPDQPPRVLIVDDDQSIVDLLVEELKKIGVNPVGAYSGEVAVDRVRRDRAAGEPIDLAIVDKNLPGIDGLATIKHIRELQPALPVMIITGYSNAESAAQAADLGVVGYVLKPFSELPEMCERIKEFAVKYAAERRERRYLTTIKKRHAQFLDKYKRVAAELDRLKD